MTDHQRRAKDFLDEYTKAASHVTYLAERCMMLRARAEKATSEIVSVECWTGEWEGISRKTGRRITTRDSTELANPRKVYAPAPRSRQDYSSARRESLMDVLVLQEEEYRQAAEGLEKLATSMALEIDKHCDDPGASVLKYCYLLKMSYQQAAGCLGYSYAHVRKLHWDALEELGEKLIQDNTK